jgi:hypothetical protein
VNIVEHLSLSYRGASFRYMPKSGIVVSTNRTIFNFLSSSIRFSIYNFLLGSLIHLILSFL